MWFLLSIISVGDLPLDFNLKDYDTGVVTSTNFPGAYPNNLVKTETIQVEQGLRLLLTFTAFNIDNSYSSCYDYLTIR